MEGLRIRELFQEDLPPSSKKEKSTDWEFLSGPMVKTLHIHCQG